VRDCNSGYRCFRREVLEKIKVDKIFSEGPSIVQEILYKVHLAGFGIREVPIVFKERNAGESKLGIKQLYHCYISVLKLKWMHITGRI
jgi:dolichol-phosphate mannosyltransferase